MKALVVGGGSIGSRHLNNLKMLGIIPLAIVEPEPERRRSLTQDNTVIGFETLESGLAWAPDFVIIATPSHLHIEQAFKAAQSNCHVFIEKPLSHTSEGLDDLAAVVEDRSLISIVGCNMRFHPGPTKVKHLLDQEAIGKLLFARVHTGSYLPEWRPWQDYRRSYSAQVAMGGGCLLDCIHEIDLTHWYLGEVESVFCVAGHLSSLDIDVEDVALLICRHIGDRLSEIHLDYVQRTYERGCQIVGERGSIFWDYNEGVVRWFNGEQKAWHYFAQSKNWHVNQMYLDELKHFLECVQTGKSTLLPVSDAVKVMRIVLAAKESAASGCLMEVQASA